MNYSQNILGMEIKGSAELQKFFDESLTYRQKRNVAISAYRKLARPIIQSARATLKPHKVSGTLSRSLKVYPFRKKPGVFVGAKRTGQLKKGTDKKSFKGIDGYYAHMVDQGTKHSSALDFWEPAVEQNAQTIGERMQTEQLKSLKRFIDRSLKRMN